MHGVGQTFQGTGQAPFIPDVQFICSIGHTGDGYGSIVVGDGIVRGVHSDNDGAHFWMNVAKKKTDARMIEADRIGGAGFVKPEIEALTVEERENVVEEGVAIGKIHDGADAHDSEMRMESFVFLKDLRFFALVRSGRRGSIEGSEPNYDAGRLGTSRGRFVGLRRSWPLDFDLSGDRIFLCRHEARNE